MRTRGQREIIQDLRDSEMPLKGNYTLQVRSSDTRMTLMSEAVDDVGIDENTEVPQVYFEDEQIVAIDLSEVGQDG
jgi:hypothetical protein